MEQETLVDSSAAEVKDTLPSTSSTFSLIYNELFSSPLNLFLTIVCGYLLYKLLRKTKSEDNDGEQFILPEPLQQHDMTLKELRKYDGTGEDKRICIAVNGLVYDCTKGRQFYGPGGPYAPFAGRDATRALANFDVTAIKDTWDDTSDLTPGELSSVQEWQEQFAERYEFIGKLVKEEDSEETKIENNTTAATTTTTITPSKESEQQQNQENQENQKQ